MIASSVHHVSVAVTDIDRAREFWGGLLGFEEIARPEFPFPGAWYQIGDTQVHLIVPAPNVDVGQRPGRAHPMAGHVALLVDDYAETRDYFKSRGVEVIETNPEVGQMWITDPDGNVVEMITGRADPGAAFRQR